MTIDFRTLNDTVRRLSTESYMEVPEVHDYHTVWIWYWQDNEHNWLPYEVLNICILVQNNLCLKWNKLS